MTLYATTLFPIMLSNRVERSATASSVTIPTVIVPDCPLDTAVAAASKTRLLLVYPGHTPLLQIVVLLFSVTESTDTSQMTPAASGGMHTNFETDFTRSESTVAVIFSAAFIVSAATVAKAAGGVGVVVVVVGDDDDDLNRRIAWVVEILSAAAVVVLGTLPLEVDLGKITAGVVVVVSLLLLLLFFPLLTVSLPFAHKTAPHFPSPVKHIPVARGSH
jgi:hypothetical protein